MKNTNAKRKAISKKLRFDIFKRDLFTCQYCSKTPPNALLQVDHIIPVCKGGDNSTDNLVTSCQECNLGKSGTLLTSIPKSLKDKAAEVKERELQISSYNAIIMMSRERLERDAWVVCNEYLKGCLMPLDSIDRAKFSSIKKFVDIAGIPTCLDAMDVALAKKLSNKNTTFKYFCGVMWNIIKDGE